MKRILLIIIGIVVVVGVVFAVLKKHGDSTDSAQQKVLLTPTQTQEQAKEPEPHALSITPTNADTPTVQSFSQIVAPQIEAKSWILVDANTQQVIAQYNPDLKVEPASLTKLMTASLVFDALNQHKISLDQMVNVTPEAREAEGSRMFIELNRPVSVGDLIQGMVVQSGNDATILLGQTVGGSENVFVDQMNQRANAYGMANSHFNDPAGLPSDQTYTTARDMSLLAQHIIKDYPAYYHYFSELEFTYNKIKQQNRNGLLRRNIGVDGLKTGHTKSAGFSLIATALRDGRRVVSVVIGTASARARESANQALLDWGFQNFTDKIVAQPNQVVLENRVLEGKVNKVKLGSNEQVAVTVPRGQENQVQAIVQLNSNKLVAPLKKGQVVGSVQFVLNNHIVNQTPLMVLEDVEQAGFFGRMWDKVVGMF